jgi:hypothetical protein
MKKRGQVWETLAPWIIALIVLVLMVILYGIISGKGTGALEFFKNLWRFGR